FEVDHTSLGIKKLTFDMGMIKNMFFTHEGMMTVNAVRVDIHFCHIIFVYIISSNVSDSIDLKFLYKCSFFVKNRSKYINHAAEKVLPMVATRASNDLFYNFM